MNFSNNKFTKTVSQFYLQPLRFGSTARVDQPFIISHSRQLRKRQVERLSQSFTQRREKSLLNFEKLSQIVQAHEKVFRSSSSFYNPESTSISKSGSKLSILLKSQILQKQFQEQRKKYDQFKQKEGKNAFEDREVSNYRYFHQDFKEKHLQNKRPYQIQRSKKSTRVK